MKRGFTLAELLIALAILGVIATFTIPKVLQSQAENQNKAVTKETVSAVAAAFAAFKQNNPVSGSTTFGDLTPFLNYVKIDTSSYIDLNYYSGGTVQCSSGGPCIHFHNGAVILFWVGENLGGTGTTNAFHFNLDPDGKVTQPGGPAFGQGKATSFFMYPNGRLTSYGSCDPNTQTGWYTPAVLLCPQPGADPLYIRNWD